MSQIQQSVYIVIPAYNEEKVISHVIGQVVKKGFSNIILVDDGSKDKTAEVAKKTTAIVLCHKINRGKGAAIKTGVEAAKQFNADIVVTMDADGQHEASEIATLVTPIIQGEADVVLGSRFIGQSGNMPLYKIIHNTFANILTWLFYGLFVSDSQSGFRAYSKHALAVINTRADSYEFDSEVIREIKHHQLRYQEISIKAVYTAYSTSKLNKQNILNGLKTIYKMVWRIIT